MISDGNLYDNHYYSGGTLFHLAEHHETDSIVLFFLFGQNTDGKIGRNQRHNHYSVRVDEVSEK